MKTQKLLSAAVCGAMLISAFGSHASMKASAMIAGSELYKEEWTVEYKEIVEKDSTNTGSLSCVAYVDHDGAIDIVATNNTLNKGCDNPVLFGTIWFDDEHFKIAEFSAFHGHITELSPLHVNYTDGYELEVIESPDRDGVVVRNEKWSNLVDDNTAFVVQIKPTKDLTGPSTIVAFGHELNITYQYGELKDPTANPGDLNCDGAVNASDAAITLQYAAYHGAGGEWTLLEWLKRGRDMTIVSEKQPEQPLPVPTDSPVEIIDVVDPPIPA